MTVKTVKTVKKVISFSLVSQQSGRSKDQNIKESSLLYQKVLALPESLILYHKEISFWMTTSISPWHESQEDLTSSSPRCAGPAMYAGGKQQLSHHLPH